MAYIPIDTDRFTDRDILTSHSVSISIAFSISVDETPWQNWVLCDASLGYRIAGNFGRCKFSHKWPQDLQKKFSYFYFRMRPRIATPPLTGFTHVSTFQHRWVYYLRWRRFRLRQWWEDITSTRTSGLLSLARSFHASARMDVVYFAN